MLRAHLPPALRPRLTAGINQLISIASRITMRTQLWPTCPTLAKNVSKTAATSKYEDNGIENGNYYLGFRVEGIWSLGFMFPGM